MKPIKFHPLKILVPPKNVKFYVDSHCTTPEAVGSSFFYGAILSWYTEIFLLYIARPTSHHHETYQITSVEDNSTTKKHQILRRFSQYHSRSIWASSEHHLGIIWASFGHHVGIIWASFGHHLGIIGALSKQHLGIIRA